MDLSTAKSGNIGMVEETKHNKIFDELLRSKYRDEKAKPAAHLWKDIQSKLPVVPVSAKPWYLSKAVLIGSSVVVAMGIISVLLYFIYIKPHETSSFFIPNSKPIPVASPNAKLKGNKISSTGFSSSPASKTKITFVQKKNKRTIPVQKKYVPVTKVPASSPVAVKNVVSNKIVNRPFGSLAINHEPVAPTAKKKQRKTKRQKPIKKTNKSEKVKNKHSAHSAKNKQKKPVIHSWTLEAFSMPGFSSRIVVSNPDYTQGIYTPSYFNLRERYTFNSSYGLMVEYRWRHSWSIETGLSYYAYAFNLSTRASYLEKTGENTEIIHTSSGSMDLDTEHLDSIGVNTLFKASTQIEYLSVPVILKYYFFKKLYLNAGPSFDYYFKQSNNVEKDDQEGNFNVRSENVEGIKRFNISIIFGVGYRQKIWKNLSFSINPVIRVHLMNINSASTVKTYPFNAGFRVYLRYGL